MVTMNTKEAILAFSQSEKIKSGIIWVTQALGVLSGLPEKNRKSAERIAHVFIGLSHVTDIGQRSMNELRDRGLL